MKPLSKHLFEKRKVKDNRYWRRMWKSMLCENLIEDVLQIIDIRLVEIENMRMMRMTEENKLEIMDILDFLKKTRIDVMNLYAELELCREVSNERVQ